MNKKRCLLIAAIAATVALLTILFDTMLTNHRPAVTGLEAEPEMVLPRGNCQITCTASDRDGDELSYNWSTTGGEISGEGATVNWTAPYSEGCYSVTVTVTDGCGGQVTSQITITARYNKSPYITTLVASADWITPSGSIPVTCTASDPDGDKLSYEWSATGGNISGTGAVVNWNAPEETGIYNFTVVVKDGHGDKAAKSVILSVALSTPPIIEDLIVTAKGHEYLRKSTAGYDYDVWKTEEYDIECIVSDMSGVVYNWLYDDGEICGEGSMITWTAPNKIMEKTTVTVIVSDSAGNRMGRSIDLYVPFCACGF